MDLRIWFYRSSLSIISIFVWSWLRNLWKVVHLFYCRVQKHFMLCSSLLCFMHQYWQISHFVELLTGVQSHFILPLRNANHRPSSGKICFFSNNLPVMWNIKTRKMIFFDWFWNIEDCCHDAFKFCHFTVLQTEQTAVVSLGYFDGFPAIKVMIKHVQEKEELLWPLQCPRLSSTYYRNCKSASVQKFNRQRNFLILCYKASHRSHEKHYIEIFCLVVQEHSQSLNQRVLQKWPQPWDPDLRSFIPSACLEITPTCRCGKVYFKVISSWGTFRFCVGHFRQWGGDEHPENFNQNHFSWRIDHFIPKWGSLQLRRLVMLLKRARRLSWLGCSQSLVFVWTQIVW